MNNTSNIESFLFRNVRYAGQKYSTFSQHESMLDCFSGLWPAYLELLEAVGHAKGQKNGWENGSSLLFGIPFLLTSPKFQSGTDRASCSTEMGIVITVPDKINRVAVSKRHVLGIEIHIKILQAHLLDPSF